MWGSDEYGRCIGEMLTAAGFPSVLCAIGHSFGGKVAVHLALQGAVRVDSLMLVGTPGARLPLSEETQRRIARVKRGKKFARMLPGPIRRSIEARYAKLGSEDYRNASGTLREILVKTVNEDIRDAAAGHHGAHAARLRRERHRHAGRDRPHHGVQDQGQRTGGHGELGPLPVPRRAGRVQRGRAQLPRLGRRSGGATQ